MVKLDGFRKKWWEKNLREHLWELSDWLLNRILSVYRYLIKSVYDLCKDDYFFVNQWY